MISKGTHTIRYDTERRPVRVNDGANILWRAAYDGNGARRKRLDDSGTIHYLGAYERNMGNGWDTTEIVTKYYHALGRLIALRKNDTLKWAGTDHLGGTIRVADASFSPVDQMRYTPYGVSRDAGPILGTDHKFTSQIEDASIGLYWYGSRAYDPTLGRFTIPDNVVPLATNPQALNRYTYVLNNPLRYTDPTGYGQHEQYSDGVRIIADIEELPLKIQVEALLGGKKGAVTFGRSLIVSNTDIFNDPDLLKHEMGHVKEAQRYQTDEVYRQDYVSKLLESAITNGIDKAYAMHPMEIEANKNANLNKYFHVIRQSGPYNENDPLPDTRPVKYMPSDPRFPGGVLPNKVVPKGLTEGQTESMSTATEPLIISVQARPSDYTQIPDNVQLIIPAEYAPGGVGVVGITNTNPSGGPANGGSWDSPGGANPQADAEARRSAWEAAGSPDYNSLHAAGVSGY